MAYAWRGSPSNIAKRKPCTSPRRTPIQETPLPEATAPPKLSDDETLVLALRLRDGVPNRVPAHRSTGACKYAEAYADGRCDWCDALDAREAAQAPAEPNPNVVVMTTRWQHAVEDAVPVRRIA